MNSIDILRGLYVRSPHWLKSSFAPLLSMVPLKYRYGNTYWNTLANIHKSQNDADFVHNYHIDNIREIIRTCNNSSDYYRNVFAGVFGGNLVPETFGLEDLTKLPLLTKDEIRSNPEKFLVKNRNDVDIVSTSGSSGEPLKFYLDKDRSVKEWAFIHHLWGRIGYKPEHRRAVLRGIFLPDVDTKPWKFDPALNELVLSPFHLVPEFMDQYLHLIEKYRINFIHGYPSAIFLLANHAIRSGWQSPSHLMGVLPISESLFSHQRSVIKTAFGGVKILMFYGLSEKVAIAGELPDYPDLYEFEPLYGYAELVNEQGEKITRPGDKGKIVATGFLSTGMPLLRYDTGDIAELVELASYENCYRLRVKGIRSRWSQEFIVGYNGALISIAAINIHSEIYSRIHAFQFYQDKPGEVSVRVVPMNGQEEKEIIPFIKEIQDKVGSNIRFTLEIKSELPVNLRGKRRFIDQKLDLSNYQ